MDDLIKELRELHRKLFRELRDQDAQTIHDAIERLSAKPVGVNIGVENERRMLADAIERRAHLPPDPAKDGTCFWQDVRLPRHLWRQIVNVLRGTDAPSDVGVNVGVSASSPEQSDKYFKLVADIYG